MARPAGGTEHIEAAKGLLRVAKTAAELRQAQAVLLPQWGQEGQFSYHNIHPQVIMR